MKMSMNTDTYVHTTKSYSEVECTYICVRYMRVVGVCAYVHMYLHAHNLFCLPVTYKVRVYVCMYVYYASKCKNSLQHILSYCLRKFTQLRYKYIYYMPNTYICIFQINMYKLIYFFVSKICLYVYPFLEKGNAHGLYIYI